MVDTFWDVSRLIKSPQLGLDTFLLHLSFTFSFLCSLFLKLSIRRQTKMHLKQSIYQAERCPPPKALKQMRSKSLKYRLSLSNEKKNMFSITIFINPFQLSFAFIWKRNSLKFLKLKLMEYACSLSSFIIQKIGLYWSFKYNAAPQCRNAPLGAEHK